MIRILVLPLIAALSLPVTAADVQPVVTYSKAKAKFEDVRDDLKNAIESKGLVIDYQSHVHTMLERTGRDVGSTKPLYAPSRDTRPNPPRGPRNAASAKKPSGPR